MRHDHVGPAVGPHRRERVLVALAHHRPEDLLEEMLRTAFGIQQIAHHLPRGRFVGGNVGPRRMEPAELPRRVANGASDPRGGGACGPRSHPQGRRAEATAGRPLATGESWR